MSKAAKKTAASPVVRPRYKRVLVCTDTHGDKIDRGAESAFFAFRAHFKPEFSIHLGDAFDFRFLRKKASDEEKRESVQEDLDSGVDFLRRFEPDIYMRGNHCERVFTAAMGDDGPLADYAATLIDEIKAALPDRCRMFPYDKRKGVCPVGDVKMLHGYACGVNMTRAHALVYGTSMFGHGHAVELAAVAGMEPRVGRQIGALAQLDLPYNKASMQTLRHQHGFSYGLLFPSGKTLFWQAQKIGSDWFLPSEVREFSAAKPK